MSRRRRPPLPSSGPLAGLCVAALAAALVAGAAVHAPGAGGPPPVARAAPDSPDARALIRKAASVYDSLETLQARFRQVIEMRVFEPPRRREGKGAWYQERPARFRMDFSEPEGDVIVADGRHLWLYYPSTHPGQVIRSRLAGATGRGSAMVDLQGRIFRQVRAGYDARYAGREQQSGRPVHHLALDARSSDTDYRRVEVWLDAETLLLRRLLLEDHSETVRTITLEALQPGASLPDSLFRFEPPPGVEVFEG